MANKMVKNRVLEKLRANEFALGVLLRQSRTVDVVSAMRTCGYDWLFLDMEHGSFSLDTVTQIAVTALACGLTPIVRVPIMDIRTAARALDNGALGVILPRVETVEQAKKIASALRYAPNGHRSVIGTLPHFDFAAPPLTQATAEMDKETIVSVIIETPTGVANVDEIAAVPGIDLLLVGSNDLTLEMGIHGEFDNPEFDKAMQKILAAGKRHGKYVGLGGIWDTKQLGRYVDQGVRFIPAGADIQFMMQGATSRGADIRKLKP
jgi:4-hydroxy-2-oxoheptanedioate aldolase